MDISEVKIIKISLLKLDKNPYLIANKEYFDNRMIEKINAKFRETIYKKYNYLCPVCQQSLFNGEEIELHHIIHCQLELGVNID